MILDYNLSISRLCKHALVYVSVMTSSMAYADSAQEKTASAKSPNNPSLEERVQQQDQQIRDLQERLWQLESSKTGDSKSGKDEAADATESQASVESPSLPKVDADLGAVKESTKILNSDDLVSDDFPGSWPMFGTDTRIKVGGYIKSDFVVDLDGTLDPTQFLMSTIPVEGTPEYGNDGYTDFFSKESRFNFDIRRIKPGAPPLRAFVEGDFFTTSQQFRLRHAYMTVGDFLIGQTWTTLSFLEAMPYIIDFAAGDALFGGRTTQVRYTKSINNHWKYAVALEQLSFLGIENPYNLPGQATTQLPLLAMRTDYHWNTGVLFLGSSVAQLHWDGGATGPSDDALQFDIVVAGRQTIGKANYVTGEVAYGDGAGENIMAFAGSYANAVLEADGTLETIPAFSLLVGGGHKWNSKWSSNLSYAYGWLDTPDTRAPLALKRGGIGHLNLVWQPV
ncbi:MAG: DcaP family trimeric outer membrane transporter [Amphritea sp.]|nr:DcaP family trimeric outer membrane transporter [Amphritea sp.]